MKNGIRQPHSSMVAAGIDTVGFAGTFGWVVAVVGVGVDVPPHAASMIAAASAKVRALIK